MNTKNEPTEIQADGPVGAVTLFGRNRFERARKDNVHETLRSKEMIIPTCDLQGMSLASIAKKGLLDHIFSELDRGEGGWLLTANLDFMRRHARDAEARHLYSMADIRVVDGTPLLWAARIQGDRFPERLAGADLIWNIAERAAAEGRTIYLLGGTSTANTEAVRVLRKRLPALIVCGNSSPMVESPPSAAEVTMLREEMLKTRPDILLVGMGSPKQEQVIQAIRTTIPGSWMAGIGASFSFVAGETRRAPHWMQSSGLEWLWRLGQEPERLARRYILEDMPFLFELVGGAIAERIRRGRRRVTWQRFRGVS